MPTPPIEIIATPVAGSGRRSTLRVEIAVAIVLKVVLLTALWFLIFRWLGGASPVRPNIADKFAPPASQVSSASVPTLHSRRIGPEALNPQQETIHVR
jgi:hypothetical protein